MLSSLHQLLDAGDLGSTQWLYSAEEQKEFTSLIERKAVECTAELHEVLINW